MEWETVVVALIEFLGGSMKPTEKQEYFFAIFFLLLLFCLSQDVSFRILQNMDVNVYEVKNSVASLVSSS